MPATRRAPHPKLQTPTLKFNSSLLSILQPNHVVVPWADQAGVPVHVLNVAQTQRPAGCTGASRSARLSPRRSAAGLQGASCIFLLQPLCDAASTWSAAGCTRKRTYPRRGPSEGRTTKWQPTVEAHRVDGIQLALMAEHRHIPPLHRSVQPVASRRLLKLNT